MKYILVINGRPEGPFSVAELQEKGLKPGDFVRTDGMADYKEAHELPELRSLFGFARQAAAPQYFAGFDQRLLAAALDWFFIATGFVLIALPIVLLVQDKMVRIAVGVSLLILIPLAYLIYHIVMESSPKQATHGKQILKIKVGDMYGERITAGHAASRNFAKLLSVLTFFIGYLMAFFTKKQQCLHDMVAGTLVVKDRLL